MATSRITRRAARVALGGCLLTAGLIGSVGVAPPLHAATAITFDYSVAPRFGADLNGDGLANDPRNSATLANATSLAVTFNACANPSSSYSWGVIHIGGFTSTTCATTHNMPPGVWQVQLRLADGRTATHVVVVRDILIVSMGDSLASGEGNPDRVATSKSSAKWQNRQCHRSSLAGPALAARAIEDADPHTSVTFVHVACSGAGLRGGVLSPYAGIEPNGTVLPSQIDQVRSIVGGRPIDVLLLNAGANDAGFGSIVVGCITQAQCNVSSTHAPLDPALQAVLLLAHGVCNVLPLFKAACNGFVDGLAAQVSGHSAARVFNDNKPLLAGLYKNVALTINLARSQGGLGTASSHVFLTEYFDPTRDELGRTCDPNNFLLDPLRTLPGTSIAETTWNRVTVVPGLNAEGATAAALAGWHRVGDIAATFAHGGYCADNAHRLVRRLDESFVRQGDEKGTLHPNGAGHIIYGQKIAALVNSTVL